MKRTAMIGVGAGTLVALSLAGYGITQWVANAATTGASPGATITVVGHADEKVAPDVATIDAGVVTKASDAQSAQTLNDAAIRKLMAALENTGGVAPGDIQTQWYNINPDYGQPGSNGQTNISDFTATDNVEITVRSLKNVGSLVDLLVQSGANQINGVNYQVSNPSAVQQQLYDQALADAKSQAARIAQALGVTVTGVQSVDTTTSGGPIYSTRLDVAAQSAAPISPGTQDISTSVNVVFTIANASTSG